MINEKVMEHGDIVSTARSIERNPNSWGDDTSLTIDISTKTGAIAHISMAFNGSRCSGVNLEELRRFKALLNSFNCI